MKSQKQEKRLKIENSKTLIGLLLAAAAVIVIFVFLLGRFVHYQENAIYQDKSSALIEIADKAGEVVNVMAETYFPITEIAAGQLVSGSCESEAEVKTLLSNIADPLLDGNLKIILIDGKSSYLCSDGYIGHWVDISELMDALEDNGIYIGTIPHLGSEQQFIFFTLNQSISAPVLNGQVEYLVAAVDLDTFSRKLVVESFGENGYTYIIREDGRVLFKQTQLDDRKFIEGYNVFTALKDCEFLHGDTVQKLSDGVATGTGVACQFTYKDGIDYFVANSTAFSNDWTILLFAKADALGSGMDSAVRMTIWYIVLLALFIIAASSAAIFAIWRDKRKREEKENERILNLNTRLRVAVHTAEEASRAKTEFLSNMSHDIRTPINGIMGMTTIALKQENSEKTNDCLEKIETASAHLLSLINDVLDMSRIERGKTEISHKPMNLRELLSGCGVIIKGQMNDRSLNYEECFDGLMHPHVLGGELHLRQVFINILGNAVKFTPDGGTITVTVSETPEADGIVLFSFRFEDTGIGMKPEFLEKIFTPFAQADNGSRTNYKGTGLGMAITKQFVELMGGEIRVASTFEKGSCFTVEIPLEIDYTEAAARTNDTTVTDISGMRILLVEDNELNMEIACELLKDEGVEVTAAEDGQIAVDTFRNAEPNHFDAVLMDIMMPNLNGYDATKAIRALDRADAGRIPIIAMSANAFEEDVKKSLEAGMNAHLAKPIKVAELLKTLGTFAK